MKPIGAGVGAGGAGLAAGFLAIFFLDAEAFFFGDFLAAGFLAVDFLADFAPFFFGDFLAARLAAFLFLAIANDSFNSKRPSHSWSSIPRALLNGERHRRANDWSAATRHSLVRAGIVSSLDKSSQGESAKNGDAPRRPRAVRHPSRSTRLPRGPLVQSAPI